MRIVEDDLTGSAIAALLQEHLDHMFEISPAEDVHALDLDGLRAPDVTFWCAWADNGDLMGCGALKQVSSHHGEIKSMRTAAGYLRQGVAAKILRHIINEARERRYRRLSLETGPDKTFGAAHELYRQFDFVECGPFGDYRLSPHSVFMRLEL